MNGDDSEDRADDLPGRSSDYVELAPGMSTDAPMTPPPGGPGTEGFEAPQSEMSPYIPPGGYGYGDVYGNSGYGSGGYGYGPYGYPPGAYGPYASPFGPGYAPRNNGKAVASMVMGIASIIMCPPVAIGGLITGYQARREIRERSGYETGAGMALAGIITSWFGVARLVLTVVIFAIFMASAVVQVGH